MGFCGDVIVLGCGMLPFCDEVISVCDVGVVFCGDVPDFVGEDIIFCGETGLGLTSCLSSLGDVTDARGAATGRSSTFFLSGLFFGEGILDPPSFFGEIGLAIGALRGLDGDVGDSCGNCDDG